MWIKVVAIGTVCLLALTACERSVQEIKPTSKRGSGTGELAQASPTNEHSVKTTNTRHAWFGETHVHSNFSVDASIYNVPASPDDAYRYAKGEAVRHSSGEMIQSTRPIDFMALTDHAEYLGMIERLKNPKDALSKLPLAKQLISDDEQTVQDAFITIASSMRNRQPLESLMQKDLMISGWQTIIDVAEQHYEPGKFTTLIGYEWTSNPTSRNLHRNVIFRNGKGGVPALPFSSFDSQHPEDLWASMDSVRKQGMPVLAIPHNSNLSDGLMFPTETGSLGQSLDQSYAATRNRNEPLVEVSQIKGSSDTHPSLSPNDEWANFEIIEELFETEEGERSAGDKAKAQGSYVRQAYKDGLSLQQANQINPYKFGLIASTDSHNSSVPTDENNYTGKFGIADDTIQQRRTGIAAGLTVRRWGGGSGLAGVWAEQNTRESIFDAMARKETFATSGPRIQLRLFAGWRFPDSAMQSASWPDMGYANGVPMGADLVADDSSTQQAPSFLVWALQDPEDAPLQRLQIIKGWMEDGQSQERVFDAACSDGLSVDEQTQRCPDNNATVDLEDCSISADKGSTELATVWRDPEFSADQSAFYYARVIQNPSCRWSSYDALRAGVPLLTDVPATVQERAWSSPIWYTP